MKKKNKTKRNNRKSNRSENSLWHWNVQQKITKNEKFIFKGNKRERKINKRTWNMHRKQKKSIRICVYCYGKYFWFLLFSIPVRQRTFSFFFFHFFFFFVKTLEFFKFKDKFDRINWIKEDFLGFSQD